MVKTSSRGSSLGSWKVATVVPAAEAEQVGGGGLYVMSKDPLPILPHFLHTPQLEFFLTTPHLLHTPQLEFFLTNGESGDRLKEDRPSAGQSLYILPTPSSYKLSFGGIRPFLRGADERVMLVSDLDGKSDTGVTDGKNDTGVTLSTCRQPQTLAFLCLCFSLQARCLAM
jgi:hypothetical protein